MGVLGKTVYEMAEEVGLKKERVDHWLKTDKKKAEESIKKAFDFKKKAKKK